MAMPAKVTMGFICLIFAKFAIGAENGLNYKSNNQTFTLKEECISSLGMNRDLFDSKEYYSLSVHLKNSRNCAQELNGLIKGNVGQHLRTYFNSDLLIDSYIAGELKTEDGFRMPLDSKELGEQILSFYNANN